MVKRKPDNDAELDAMVRKFNDETEDATDERNTDKPE